ncbi:MAG: tyrosine-protein phosphatase [Eubacterium sp.]|nr:tyrosine-protein phosphatase [Eubacterium sp.]
MNNRLPLSGMPNTRDLGGIRTQDGHYIKSKKLIKSGMLYRATPEDIDILTREYDVRTIIDLRTRKERIMMPNPQIKGVSEIWNPLFMEDIQGLGIFGTMDRDILENRLKSLFILRHRADEKTEEAMNQIRDLIRDSDIDPDAYMKRMYMKFVNNQIVQKQIKQFFYLVSNNRGGAILWHCAAGKDRAGICTALLLYALGVSKEAIIANYMESAESSEDAVEYLLTKLFPDSDMDSQKNRDLARCFFDVKTCYIEAFFDAVERDYVSIDNYLQKALEQHTDNLVHLRTLYLQ